MLSKTKFLLKDPDGYGKYKALKEGDFIYLNDDEEICDSVNCREIFEGDYFDNNSKIIAFHATNMTAGRMNDFFSSIFKPLKLKQADQITFYNTNLKNIVVLELPKFWRDTETKRGFLTLFIRASTFSTNIFNSLKKYKLMAGIKDAVEYFLKGHTKPTGELSQNADGYGIVASFEFLGKDEIAEKLIKP